MRTAPLNGTKTHPLSEHAKGELKVIASGPRPAQELNPGVKDRLLRGGLIEIVQMPSPYAKHRGAHISFVRITADGRLVADAL